MFGKNELKTAIAGKNRGLLASPTDKQAILSAIARLEDHNPTPRPLEAPDLLEGIWRLLYTTSAELLGLDRFPFVDLGQIYQCIRTRDARIFNIAELSGLPFLDGLVSVSATYQPVSERRVEVTFERAVLGWQQAMGYRSPDQLVDTLTRQQRLPLLQAIDFSITPNRRPGWLEITYLDADMRIGRGNEGNVFVLTR